LKQATAKALCIYAGVNFKLMLDIAEVVRSDFAEYLAAF